MLQAPSSTAQRSRRIPLAILGLSLVLQHAAVAFEPADELVPTKAPTEPSFAFPPAFLPTNPFTPPPQQQQVIVPTPFQITFPTDAPDIPILPTTAPTTTPRFIFTLAPVPTATTPPTVAPSTLAPVTEAPVTVAPVTLTPTTSRNGPVTTTPETNPSTTVGGGGDGRISTSPPTTVPQTPPTAFQVFPPDGGSIPTIPALTVVPTVSPQAAPPTVAPTSSEPRAIKAMIQGVTMTLTGVTTELTPYDRDIFGEEYSAWFDDYFDDSRRRRRLQSLYGVTDMVSGLDVTNQEATEDGTGMIMTFTQSLDYIALPNLAPPPDEVVLLPFQTPNDRTDLVNTLQRNVDSMRVLESVTVPQVIPPVGPEPKKGETWATPSVIAGITGGCALLIGTIAFLLFFCCGTDNGKDSNESTASESPLQQFQFGTSGSEDNVSAFDADNGGGFDGTTKTAGQSTDALSVGNYGEQSVATVDYDYTTAYGGGSGAASVVSSVGGTLGDATRHTAAGGEAPAASLGAGYEAMRGVQEEVIVIEAPPGKLGVVIDTPDDGAPLVHAVKDSSIIADLIQVGDKLLAVDDDDVQAMTAIKVSKLISKRSGNAVRKLTIVRTTHVGAV